MKNTSLTKRSNDVNVEALDNGFVVSYTGRSDDDWVSGKIYCRDLAEVANILGEYFSLEQD